MRPAAQASALTIYSPAPPGISLHAHNEEFGAALASAGLTSSVVAMALPQSVNRLSEMGALERALHLPIMTTVDFVPAIAGGGPAEHAYDRANADLKFVSSLYDVVFGVLAFDKSIRSPEDLKGRRIAAPPPQSSVRVLTDMLIGDGWGLLGEVDIVEMPPSQVPAAIAERRVDATTWNVMSLTASGVLPMIAPLLAVEGANWIDVDADIVSAINAANAFTIEATQFDAAEIIGLDRPMAGTHSLLSFRQAIAAWDTTPIDTVRAILSCIEKHGTNGTALPRSRAEMMHWPGMTDELMHPGAIEFFRGTQAT